MAREIGTRVDPPVSLYTTRSPSRKRAASEWDQLLRCAKRSKVCHAHCASRLEGSNLDTHTHTYTYTRARARAVTPD